MIAEVAFEVAPLHRPRIIADELGPGNSLP